MFKNSTSSILLILASLLTLQQSVTGNFCEMVKIGSYEGGDDIVSAGLLNNLYDKDAHLNDPWNLHYVSDNFQTSQFWLSALQPVDVPVSLTVTPQIDNSMHIEDVFSYDFYQLVEIDYFCPYDKIAAGTQIDTFSFSLSLSFGSYCGPYILSWQKSCEKAEPDILDFLKVQIVDSALSKQTLIDNGISTGLVPMYSTSQHYSYIKLETTDPTQGIYMSQPPFISNLIQSQNTMYPVLKGNAARGGDLSSGVERHLYVEFNCMGIESTNDLHIQLSFDGYKDYVIQLRKQCPKESFYSLLQKDIQKQSYLATFFYSILSLLSFGVISFAVIFTGNFFYQNMQSDLKEDIKSNCTLLSNIVSSYARSGQDSLSTLYDQAKQGREAQQEKINSYLYGEKQKDMVDHTMNDLDQTIQIEINDDDDDTEATGKNEEGQGVKSDKSYGGL